METKSNPGFYHKFILCLLTGLVCGASFNRLGDRFLSWLLPGLVIMIINALITLGPIVFAVFWQLSRKEKDANKNETTLYFWQGLLRFGVAFDIAMFGWMKIFRLQFWFPIEKLDEPFSTISNYWLTWMFFGRSYPMDFTIGMVQIVGGFLLLFNKTRLAGVFILIPVLLNVVLIDYFYDMGTLIFHAGIMLAGVLYLLFSEFKSLREFFFPNQDRLPDVKMNSIVKMLLRASLVVIPLLFIILRKDANEHPGLKGKYEVQRISINDIDKTNSIHCDSVLSVVYIEVGNTCIFQFKNTKQRIMGHYEYNEGDKNFNVRWLRAEEYRNINENYIVNRELFDLEAKLQFGEESHVTLSGKMGNDVVDVELVKVK